LGINMDEKRLKEIKARSHLAEMVSVDVVNDLVAEVERLEDLNKRISSHFNMLLLDSETRLYAEIERLRAALEEILDVNTAVYKDWQILDGEGHSECRRIAAKALK
jgi:archaellum component FlaC